AARTWRRLARSAGVASLPRPGRVAGARRCRALPVDLRRLQSVARRDRAPALHRNHGKHPEEHRQDPDRQKRVGLGCCALSAIAWADRAAASAGAGGRTHGPGASPAAGSHAMMTRSLAIIGGVAVVVLILIYTTFFTVRQTDIALVLEFGKPIRVIDKPGLQFKLPYQNVVSYDRR